MIKKKPKFTNPARCWALFLLGIALLLKLVAPVCFAAFHPKPRSLARNKASQEEVRSVLKAFEAAGATDNCWLQFELHVMPHHGEERTLHGQLFYIPDTAGPLTRIQIGEHTWLVRSGSHLQAWTVAGGQVRKLSEAESLQPIEGTNLTLFALQMPFLYWEDFAYEGISKIRGRQACHFLIYPPADLAAVHPDLTGMRVAFDSQFQVLLQAEALGPKGEPVQSIGVLSLKEVGGQWLVKSIDLRNLMTRDKTRLSFTAVALQLELSASVFTPESLTGALPPPPASQIQYL